MVENCTHSQFGLMLLLYCDKHLRTSFISPLQATTTSAWCTRLQKDNPSCLLPLPLSPAYVLYVCKQLIFRMYLQQPGNLVCPVRKFGFFSCMSWLNLCMERFVQICWWSGSLGCRNGHASPQTQVQANETKV